MKGAHETVNDVAITPDSRHVLGAEDHQAVRVWDIKSGRLTNIALTGHSGKVTGVSTFLTDSSQVVSCATDRTIKIWSLAKGVSTRTIPFTSTARRVKVLAEGSLIVSGHFDGRLRFWDIRIKGSSPAHEVDAHGGREICGLFSTPQSHILCSAGRDNAIGIIDFRKFSVLHRLNAPDFCTDVWCQPALSPGGEFVAAGSKDGSTFVWDLLNCAKGVARCEQLRHPRSSNKEQQNASILSASWNPSGLPLVAGDRMGTVTFWGSG